MKHITKRVSHSHRTSEPDLFHLRVAVAVATGDHKILHPKAKLTKLLASECNGFGKRKK